MSEQTLRIDKWLWRARFFKSRTLASKLCGSGKLRRNSELIGKAHATLKEGDVLTFPKEDDIRIIRVIALGSRRGPASEAEGLYDDLQPPEPGSKKRAGRATGVAVREAGAGRPTKAERRAIDKLRDHD
ncbi:MAG: RNA-binding S4 domain-containing protein [Rhodospirillaceae bacterium]|nr:RNA-binding S4 domain-containing protein [Rhodospirillaceae bacterium]